MRALEFLQLTGFFMSRILLRFIGLAALLVVLFLAYRQFVTPAGVPAEDAQIASAGDAQVAAPTVDANSQVADAIVDAVSQAGAIDAAKPSSSSQVSVPDPQNYVTDQTETLSSAELVALEAALVNFQTQKNMQIRVLIVFSTQPEDIADYTRRVADRWKMLREGAVDDVLIVVAKDDRRLRLATAQRTERAIPDALAQRIIDEQMAPAFKQGQYAQGLQAGVTAVMELLQGGALPQSPKPEQNMTDWVKSLDLQKSLKLIGEFLFIVPFGFIWVGLPIRLLMYERGWAHGRRAWTITLVIVLIYVPAMLYVWPPLAFLMFAGLPAVIVGFLVKAVWQSIRSPAADIGLVVQRSSGQDTDDQDSSGFSSSSNSSSRSSSTSSSSSSRSSGGASGSW